MRVVIGKGLPGEPFRQPAMISDRSWKLYNTGFQWECLDKIQVIDRSDSDIQLIIDLDDTRDRTHH
jgi:hypothetical protein